MIRSNIDMGLTFRKRDDFDKMMDDLGVSTGDLDTDKATAKTDKQEDPFAKFLEPKDTSKTETVDSGK
nr:SPJ_0845 family protein [Lactococcus garvieae]